MHFFNSLKYKLASTSIAIAITSASWAGLPNVVILPASKSTFVNKGDDSVLHGSDAALELSNQWSDYARQAFIQWDLSSIPVGQTVSDAKLVLCKAYGSEGDNHHTIVLEQVLGKWDENTLSHADKPSLTNDVLATLSLIPKDSSAPSGTEYTLSSPEFTRLVNDWITGREVNNGISLRATETTDGVYFAFFSNDSIDGDLTPRLIITFGKPGQNTSVSTTKTR
jgi:hypothetical protein